MDTLKKASLTRPEYHTMEKLLCQGFPSKFSCRQDEIKALNLSGEILCMMGHLKSADI